MTSASYDEELYRRVDEVLHYLWDPIGIAGIPAARDEYESYVPQVFTLLKEGSDADRIASYLVEIATKRMGLAENLKHVREVAEVLLVWKDRALQRSANAPGRVDQG